MGDDTPIIQNKDDVALAIEADKPEYEAANLIRLDITLTNKGDKLFTLPQGDVEDFFSSK